MTQDFKKFQNFREFDYNMENALSNEKRCPMCIQFDLIRFIAIRYNLRVICIYYRASFVLFLTRTNVHTISLHDSVRYNASKTSCLHWYLNCIHKFLTLCCIYCRIKWFLSQSNITGCLVHLHAMSIFFSLLFH